MSSHRAALRRILSLPQYADEALKTATMTINIAYNSVQYLPIIALTTLLALSFDWFDFLRCYQTLDGVYSNGLKRCSHHPDHTS